MANVCRRCRTALEPDARFCGMCGATIVDANAGRVIGGRYKLRERIGTGSLGAVYAAEQLGLGRKLAIKLLPADEQRDFNTTERFIRAALNPSTASASMLWLARKLNSCAVSSYS